MHRSIGDMRPLWTVRYGQLEDESSLSCHLSPPPQTQTTRFLAVSWYLYFCVLYLHFWEKLYLCIVSILSSLSPSSDRNHKTFSCIFVLVYWCIRDLDHIGCRFIVFTMSSLSPLSNSKTMHAQFIRGNKINWQTLLCRKGITTLKKISEFHIQVDYGVWVVIYICRTCVSNEGYICHSLLDLTPT